MCESGGDYGAVNPSSGAGGAYQILPSTWELYGGQGAPQDAPKAEQDRSPREIWADSGLQRLGLRLNSSLSRQKGHTWQRPPADNRLQGCRTMEAVRSRWTDERLDDLSRRMDLGFQRVDEEFRALRAEMNARFDSLHARHAGRCSGTMIAMMVSMMATIIGGFLVTNL